MDLDLGMITDLKLSQDHALAYRKDGTYVCLPYHQSAELEGLYNDIMQTRKPDETWMWSDFSRQWQGVRWRVQVTHTYTGWVASMRAMPGAKPKLTDLALDAQSLISVAINQGVTLIGGPPGSGKSTTMAAVVNELSERDLLGPTVTIEEPIEFVYENPLIHQREVGVDCKTFEAGIIQAMRQALKTIVIGEVRDRETANEVIRAGLSGHRVLATIHAQDCRETVSRLMTLADQQYAEMIPYAMQGMVAQHMLKLDGGRMLPLVETLYVDPPIRSILLQGADKLKFINENEFVRQRRMTLRMCAREMVRNRVVDYEYVSQWAA